MERPGFSRRWTVAASIAWSVALAALLARAGLHPARASSLTTYLAAGQAWVQSRDLYTNWRGFVYMPPIAWLFGLMTRLPLVVASIMWRATTAGFFLAGIAALLRSGVFHRIPRGSGALVFLAALPLSIGNIDNAQANPLVAGFIMLSVAAAQWESWWLCAAAVGIATVFKVYPIVVGLLLCVVRPRQLCWRLPLVLAVLLLLPFAAPGHSYLVAQYHTWLRTRLADDRFIYTIHDAPLDLWFLLVRLGNLPLSERLYEAFQCLSGLALAIFVWRRSRQDSRRPDALSILFLSVSAWMLLLGPATENQTYVVLAPAACLLAVEPNSRAAKCLALAAYALLLISVARNSFAPHLKSPLCMAIQPLGALVLACAIAARESAAVAMGREPMRA